MSFLYGESNEVSLASFLLSAVQKDPIIVGRAEGHLYGNLSVDIAEFLEFNERAAREWRNLVPH